MKTTLIIPDRLNSGEDWPKDTLFEEIARAVGGFTLIPAVGYWHSQTLGVVRESVYVLQCENDELREWWRVIAESIAVCASQEAVYLQFNDEPPLFVTQPTSENVLALTRALYVK